MAPTAPSPLIGAFRCAAHTPYDRSDGQASMASRPLNQIVGIPLRPPPSLPPLQDMHGELSEQQPRVERLQGAAAAAHDQLGALSREAQRV